MADDSELLSQYCRDRSEAAFAEVVRRHLNLVYSAALRQVGGDAHLAQDVSQVVFTQLALKAPGLAHRVSLTGWLYCCARFNGARLRRGERRRWIRQAEARALMETDVDSSATLDAERLGPLLDGALGGLSGRDRELVLLRYFQEHSFVQISAKLGLSADAARFRLERALGKMRAGLARRGIESTSAALALALAGQAQAVVPAGLGTAIAGNAAASGSAASVFPLTQILMSTTKMKIGVFAAAAVIGTLVVLDVSREYRLRNLRAELQDMQRGSRSSAAGAAPETNGAVGENAVVQLTDLRSKIEVRAASARFQPAPNLKPGMKAIGALSNSGQATPFAATETAIWARATGDVATLAKMITFLPDARGEADQLWASLPPGAQVQYPTPEAVMAVYLAKNFSVDWDGYQVTGDRQDGPTPDYWLVQFQYQKSDGSIGNGGLAFQQVNGNWMMLVGPGSVRRLANYLAGAPDPSASP